MCVVERRRGEMGYWEGVLTRKSLITDQSMASNCIVLSLGYGECHVFMAWRLTFNDCRLLRRLELLEECYFRRILNKVSL